MLTPLTPLHVLYVLCCVVLLCASCSVLYVLCCCVVSCRVILYSSCCVCRLLRFFHLYPLIKFYPLTHFDPFDLFESFRVFDSYNNLNGSTYSISSNRLPPRAFQRVKINFWESPIGSKCLTHLKCSECLECSECMKCLKRFEVFGVNCPYSTLEEFP